MHTFFRFLPQLFVVLALTGLAGCAGRQNVEDLTSTALNEKIAASQQTQSLSATPRVTMDASLLSELEEEGELHFTGPFAILVPTDGTISSQFGIRKHPTKKRRVLHQGIDITARRGTPVMAAAPGRILFAGNKGRGYGKVVEIEHGKGYVTRYAHLDTIYVKKGQKVTPEHRIGLVGRTGRTTGPNLHLEVLANGTPMNPERFLGTKSDHSRDVRVFVEKKRTLGGS